MFGVAGIDAAPGCDPRAAAAAAVSPGGVSPPARRFCGCKGGAAAVVLAACRAHKATTLPVRERALFFDAELLLLCSAAVVSCESLLSNSAFTRSFLPALAAFRTASQYMLS